MFVERGYAATKMTDVAAAAEVSVELVYGAFRTKANLLKTVFDITIAGDDEPVPMMERPALLAIRAEPDPGLALRMYAAFVAETAPRVYPVHLVVLTAASGEPAAAALADELATQRLTGMTMFAAQLRDSGRLAVPEDQARDLLWTLNSAQVYDLLVVQRGWSLPRYEQYLAETWTHHLLVDAPTGGE
ncbi:MAG: TetR/AcrR family transcriptional regulator [Actinobacteria bacterium]|nr:TetR/AcrR family transcriptional regulator [Actinomycetota bacterium]